MKMLKAILAALVMLTPSVANATAMMFCKTSNNEAFVVYAREDKATIQWQGDEENLDVTVKDNVLYAIQNGDLGTFTMIYDFNIGAGASTAVFKDGRVVKSTLICRVQ
jgi:hypothetical protein